MVSATRCTDGLFRISVVNCSLFDVVIMNVSKGSLAWCPARVGLGTDPLSNVYSRPDWSS